MQTDKKTTKSQENDILYSKSVKAGQRIYYLDVKKNKRGDMYLSITESKRTTPASQDLSQTNFEKHKIFIFQEDFEKFGDSLKDVMDYIRQAQGDAEPREEAVGKIEIEMDFQDIQ